MKILILTIGSEILSGSTVNTNATFISKQLFSKGYLVDEVLTIPDEEDLLKKAVVESTKRFDLIITTGGLGPTFDDKTRKILAKCFDTTLQTNEALKQDLQKRFKHLSSVDDQAIIPEKAQILPNAIGTAPGLWLEDTNCALIALPGVPIQMKQIFTEEAMPKICKTFPNESIYRQKEFFLYHLVESDVDPLLRELQSHYPTISFGVYPSYGTLSIKMTYPKQVEPFVERAKEAIIGKFKDYIFSEESGDIALAFHKKMIEQNKTFALAESCTGGAFAARLTSIADASKYFLGSAVTYSNLAKEQLLGVSKSTLSTQGAVSEECVKEMLTGALQNFSSDLAVSISGIAGPTGGSKEKPVGTIWVAYGCKNNIKCALVPTKATYPRDLMISYTINWTIGKLLKEFL